jgi:hypothetical protein
MHDILFGIRLLYRRVGASIIIVLVLALGIGANTAMFTVTAVSQLGHAKLRPIFLLSRIFGCTGFIPPTLADHRLLHGNTVLSVWQSDEPSRY